MTTLGERRSRWLEAFDWQAVTTLNSELCSRHGALHKPTSDGHDDCQRLWLDHFQNEMTFREVLDLLLSCHRLAPFCFNNGNSFAVIARTMILQLDLSASAAIVRSAAGHYVAGVLPPDELDKILAEITFEE